MKKFTFFAVLLMAAVTSAQVTYNSSDYATAGEQFTVTKASGFIGLNFATTGANHNWNYSQLNVDSQETSAPWDNPNNSGYKLAWCLTNGYLFNCNSQFNNNFTHAALLSDGFALQDYGVSNIVEHSRVNSSAFENRMRGISATISGITIPMTVAYTTPDVVYHFPMVYNDSYSTDGLFNFDLGNLGLDFQYTLATHRTNTVQGWGSITTPHGTYPNVLKMKCVLQKTETIVLQGISIPITTTTVSYQWFDPNFGIPVLQADGTELFGLFIPISVSYIDGEQCLPPNAAFVASNSNYNPQTQNASVAFSNSSVNYDAVEWNFGDGTTSTENTPSHVYNCPGTHQVTLTATNNTCTPVQTNTITQTVVVTDTQNELTSEITLSGNTLTATRDVPGTTYQWYDCDNGNTAIDGATGQSFTPTVSGNYSCTMNTNGCEATSVCHDVILCQAPNALFTASGANYDASTQSAVVDFTNTSSNFDTIEWNFGDGATSGDNAPSHSYNCPGTHEVTLAVSNSCNPSQVSTLTQSIVITDTENALTDEITLSGTTLTATRNVPGTTYQWYDCDNGNVPVDGATSQSFTPTVSGNYSCAMNTNGCEATSACHDVILCLTPNASFTSSNANYDAVTQSAAVTFTNSSGNYDSVEWSFDDGATSTEDSPTHVFNCPGFHNVTLTVHNSCNPALPSALTQGVLITDTDNVLSLEVTLSGNTLTATRNIDGTTYQWIDCDNANTSIDGATSQSFTPLTSGNYAVMMSTNGCESTSLCTSVQVLAASQFNASAQIQLFPNPTTGKLQLSGNAIVTKVEVYNTLGMLVAKQLEVTNQAAGVYFVRITTDQGTLTRKVIKE